MCTIYYSGYVTERRLCIVYVLVGVSVTGVPLSNQWGQQGYFYPVQIAQYGLSHYSKYVKKSAKSKQPVVIEDAEDGSSSRWVVTGDATVHNIFDENANSRVIQFQTKGEGLLHSSLYSHHPTNDNNCLTAFLPGLPR